MDISQGRTILHYTILRQLGAGGMGVVYEAEDTKLGRHVALKFLGADVEQDPTALERFRQEARAASALNHPNICTIYAIEECDGQSFIAMELLGRREPEREDPGQCRLPIDKLLDIGIQVTDALDVAHSKGIVAPRHQAGQHFRDQPRTGQDPRFRTGQAGARPARGAWKPWEAMLPRWRVRN